jgi:hypothetical protein
MPAPVSRTTIPSLRPAEATPVRAETAGGPIRPVDHLVALEDMTATELAHYLWTELKAPGREAELHRAELILSEKTGERRAVVSGSFEDNKAQAMAMPIEELRSKVAFYEGLAPRIPKAKEIAEAYRSALESYPGTPGSVAAIEANAAHLSSATLRKQIASCAAQVDTIQRMDPDDVDARRVAAEATLYASVWQDVLRRRESGQLKDPGEDYLKHPQAIGSLEDPLLARFDRGLQSDGTRKSTYAPRDGQAVFGPTGPRAEDVRQGHVTNCWMMSVFVGLAKARPDVIAGAIRSSGDGVASVALYSPPKSGLQVRETVTIDLDFPAVGDRLLYAHPPEGGPLWPAILEKAFAARSADGYEAFEVVGIANSGEQTPQAVLEALVGGTVTVEEVDQGSDVSRLARLLEGSLRRDPTVCRYVPKDGGRMAHQLAVTSIDASAGIVTVRDPLGADSRNLAAISGVETTGETGELRMPAAVFFALFDQIQVLHLG